MTAANDLQVRAANLPAQVALDLTGCLHPPLEALTLPPACYVDADVHEAERTAVFRTGWVGVGRSDRWSNVGDYSAIDLGGIPLIVVRGADETLHAYANSCRHRSAQIMVGEGSCKRMRCPFPTSPTSTPTALTTPITSPTNPSR